MQNPNRTTLPVPTYIEYCSIAEDNQKTVWIGCDEALLSFDGTNWTVNNRDDGVVDYVNSMAFDKYNIKWIASYSGLWSFDGKVFKNHTDYDAHPVLSDIKIDEDGIIWGAGDGLYSFNPDSSNGVNDFRSPAEFLITGIHPNPFNPSTTISFSLPAAGKAQLAIFDITGQKVRTLISGDLSAGSHSAVWNGRDGDGCAVSSGVYFARLESGKSAQTMKMLLMR
jgi:hypothetical protein